MLDAYSFPVTAIMNKLLHLFEKNESWAKSMEGRDAQFFHQLEGLQAPRYLWIGCSDSRVPANEITGLLPGELFVHRNVANVVVHSDLNCLSVMQFAVEVLKVEHIMIVGHYGCGGVAVALRGQRMGLVDNWLRHIQDVRDKHSTDLAQLADEPARLNRLCELNAIEQATNVCHTTIVQDAWSRGQTLSVHAWVYALSDGRIRDLNFCASGVDQVAACYDGAIRTKPRRLVG